MAAVVPDQIEAIRRFNRLYTKHIGLLNEHVLASRFSLTAARVLYELARHESVTATAVGRELGLDGGYLSRLLRGFRRQRLVTHRPARTDGRQRLLALSPQGRQVFARLDQRARDEVRALLGRLSGEDQRRLVAAMCTIEGLLGPAAEQRVPYVLRGPEAGDMGWVVQRHGAFYAHEYGWDARFEALVAEIVARFVKQFDPKRERCWIAERDGENVGCVFLVAETATVSRLRLLLVDPKARGLGIGSRLVAECVRFARQVGYERMTLWTNSVLDAARHIYEVAGFRLMHEEQHNSFGHDLVGQTWELTL